MQKNYRSTDYTKWHLPEGAKARLGKGWILDIQFSPDGRHLGIGSTIGVWIYDAHIGEVLNLLPVYNGYVWSIAFSPDGRTLASGNGDDTVRLWDIDSGENTHVFTGKASVLAFSPDGRTLASGFSQDNMLLLWDTTSGKHKHVLTGPTNGIDSIAFSPDGRTLASAGHFDRAIRLWDVGSGKHKDALTGPTNWIKSIAFSPDGQTIASGDWDDAIRLWDTTSKKNTHTLVGHNNSVESVEFSPDGRTLASAGGYDKTVRLWDVKSGKEKYVRLENTDRCVNSITFSPDGQTIASISDRRIVQLWNPVSRKYKHTLTGYRKEVGHVTFSSDGKTLASGSGFSHDNTLCLWDTTSGEHKSPLITPHKSITRRGIRKINSIVFSPDGKTVENIDWYVSNFTSDPDGGTISPDQRMIASISDVNIIRLLDVASKKYIHIFTGHTSHVNAVAFSPNGQTLASGSSDGTILLWDAEFLQSKVASAEANTKFLNRESRIQQICEDRGITTLVHFTKVKYLRNILYEGLLDHQSLLEKHGQWFVPNDQKRIDGHKEAICLSISFPNSQLFQKFSWSDNDGQPDYSGWVVLLLDAKVLWELDCAFCRENAASNAVRHILIEEKKKTEALENMFIEVCRDTKGNVYQRQSLQIPDDYPTHPQAEVLVFDQISSDYIREVHFYDETALKKWRDNNPWINPERLFHNQQYFRDRRDQVVWEDDNLDDDDIPFGSRINDDDDIPF